MQMGEGHKHRGCTRLRSRGQFLSGQMTGTVYIIRWLLLYHVVTLLLRVAEQLNGRTRI